MEQPPKELVPKGYSQGVPGPWRENVSTKWRIFSTTKVFDMLRRVDIGVLDFDPTITELSKVNMLSHYYTLWTDDILKHHPSLSKPTSITVRELTTRDLHYVKEKSSKDSYMQTVHNSLGRRARPKTFTIQTILVDNEQNLGKARRKRRAGQIPDFKLYIEINSDAKPYKLGQIRFNFRCKGGFTPLDLFVLHRGSEKRYFYKSEFEELLKLESMYYECRVVQPKKDFPRDTDWNT